MGLVINEILVLTCDRCGFVQEIPMPENTNVDQVIVNVGWKQTRIGDTLYTFSPDCVQGLNNFIDNVTSARANGQG